MSSRLPVLGGIESLATTPSTRCQIWPIPLQTHERARRRALMVGSGKNARSLAQYLNLHPRCGLSIHGYLSDGAKQEGALGGVHDLSRIALAQFIDEVIVAEPCDRELVQRVVNEATRLRLGVRVMPNLFGMDPKLVAMERLGDLPMLKLREQPVPRFGLFLKGTIDFLVAATALTLLLPLFAGITLLIAVSSGWPVFYRARRIGKKGQAFVCYKFRTMVEGADAQKLQLRRRNERCGPTFKMADDPRVTRVGHWLRRYSLDELPQLWNVLRGNMSLVGPRPHPLDDCARYEPEDLRRLEVKPGVTGLWQVTARNDPSFQRNMTLDLEYIERWSLRLDLQILWKTIAAVVGGSGT